MQTYLFIDFETTGLDPRSCEITEVAAILTKGPEQGFEEIDRYQTAIRHPYDLAWGRRALDMAKSSGLLAALDVCEGEPLTKKSVAFLAIAQMIACYKRPILAARNCAFERGFLKEHAPGVADRLHYREFDITPLCLIDPTLYDFDHGLQGTPHRAMYDIERDLEYAREFCRRYEKEASS